MKVILTLSEDRSICESIRATLPESNVLLFESTLELGMRRLVSTPADLVLLDDTASLGIDALRKLITLIPDIPVLVLTSKRSDDVIAQYTMAGARGCIPKPFDVAKLIEDVERCAVSAAPAATPAAAAQIDDPDTASVTQYQQALRWMSRNTMYLDSPARLVQSLTDALIDILDPTRVCVLLEANGAVRVEQCHGLPDNVTDNLVLSYTRGLMRQLSAHSSMLDVRGSLDDDTGKELSLLGGVIALPLLAKGQTIGAVVLGRKTSGLEYTRSERDLLATMIRCTSTCLERSTQYKAIAIQQQRFNTLLSNITAGVVMVHPNRTIAMMNDSAEEILRLNRSEFIGQPIIKLGSAFADIVLRTMQEGKPRIRQEIEDVSINAHLGLTVTPLGDEGVVVIFSRLPRQDRTVSPEQNISYSPLWEYLATRVAQEIKNPMVPINTYAQLLPSKFESEEFRTEFSGIVQESVGRINKVVESIYEFARHPRLNRHNKNLNETIERILETYTSTFDERAITIERKYAREGTDVSLDPNLFARAMENLVLNSIDAMPEGGVITIETGPNENGCQFSITDTGTGIDEKDAPLIFMPFFSTKENGMGLGLTMADRIFKEHNGTIQLDQTNHRGGKFIMTLPRPQEN